ncbi:hypothetical protein K438DRAFT_1783201 [Mycena galopus ATCC 62051]|nr:hypothetical protein K438DRAFT_1783201 [Mycena galopus ATCC 62051]
MTNNRIFVPTTRRAIDRFVNARVYSSASKSSSPVPIHTRSTGAKPGSLRYPCVEDVLDGAAVQAHVHDVFVILKHRGRTARFRLFFKRHVRLPKSKSAHIRGDLVVMRVGSKNDDSVVNMRAGDRQSADFIVKKMAKAIRDFQSEERILIPLHLEFVRN